MAESVNRPEVRWDARKAWSNLRKHKISFEEAATVFNDGLSVTKPDPDHSVYENRFLTLWLSFRHRLVFVCHTDDPDEIRIISARLPTRSEQNTYQDN